MLELDTVKIRLLNHAGFKIIDETAPKTVVYIDPYDSSDTEQADIILLTHDHYDHCSIEDIKSVCTPNTVVLATPACQSKLNPEKIGNVRKIKLVRPGMKVQIADVLVETVPSYNINKDFHPKADENVGYIVTINGKRIYHAGDTDRIPEMKDLKNIDVALLPVSGIYVMTSDEAVMAALDINPKVAVPMHYGSIVGSSDDAENFSGKLQGKVEVEIL